MSSIQHLKDVDRLFIQVPFHLKAPFHLGSGQPGFITDALIQRRSNGEPYIPATSLTGLLHSAADSLAVHVTGQPSCQTSGCGRCPACNLFGFTPPAGVSGGAASRLTVEDAFLVSHTGINEFEFRQHVGINRKRAAAQPKLQYNHEVAPGGLDYAFEMQVEKPTPADLRLVLAILDLWKEIGFGLGGRTTTGLGECELGEVQFFGVDFSLKKHLVHYLLTPATSQGSLEMLPDMSIDSSEIRAWSQAGATPALNPGVEVISPPAAIPDDRALQHVTIDLAVAGLEPLLVLAGKAGATTEEKGSDAEFIRTTMLKGGRFSQDLVLPGSGLKGILRSRVEKIIRTLNFYQEWDEAGKAHQNRPLAEQKYAEHICACAITHLNDPISRLVACFGTPEKQNEAEKHADAVYAASCPTCRMFGNSMLRGRLTVSEGRVISTQELHEKLFDNVAIDRFTGGASDERKFDSRPLMPLINQDEPVFAFRFHLQYPEPWMLALFALVIKDLHSGDIRIGHATHRGYGRVRGWVTDSKVLCLPGTPLSGLLAQVFGPGSQIFPYKKYILPLGEIFSTAKWDGDGYVGNSAMASFLRLCDQQFRSNLAVWSQPETEFGRIPAKEED